MVTGGNHATRVAAVAQGRLLTWRSSAGQGQQAAWQAWGTVGQLPAWGPHTCGSTSWPTVVGSLGRNMASQASPCKKRGRRQGFQGSQGHSLAREQQMAARALEEQCPLKTLLLTKYQLYPWQSQQVLQPLIPTSLTHTQTMRSTLRATLWKHCSEGCKAALLLFVWISGLATATLSKGHCRDAWCSKETDALLGYRGHGPETGGSSWILSTGRPHSRQWIQAIPQSLSTSTFQKFKWPVCGLGMQRTNQAYLGIVTMSMLSCPGWLTCTIIPLPCLSPHDLGLPYCQITFPKSPHPSLGQLKRTQEGVANHHWGHLLVHLSGEQNGFADPMICHSP